MQECVTSRPSRAEPQTLLRYFEVDTTSQGTQDTLLQLPYFTHYSPNLVSQRIQSSLATSILGSAWSLSLSLSSLIPIRDTCIAAIEPDSFPNLRFLSIYPPFLLCLMFSSSELDTLGLQPSCDIQSPSKSQSIRSHVPREAD